MKIKEIQDEIVDEFVRIYAFYMTEIGVDGLRIDTVKHVHHQFWTDFVQRLRSGPAQPPPVEPAQHPPAASTNRPTI